MYLVAQDRMLRCKNRDAMGPTPSYLQSSSTYSIGMEVTETKMKLYEMIVDIIETMALLIVFPRTTTTPR